MAKAEVTIPLGIPDVRVLKTEMTKRGEVVITIESTKKGTNCRWCGCWITKSHGYDDWVKVRHLPVFGRPTYLRYQPRRYQCDRCEKKPTTTQRLAWHEQGSPHTRAYDEHLLCQLVNATVEDVSIKEHLKYDKVLGAMERCIATDTEWFRYTRIGTLGLDEIALKKGHRNYVTIVSARLPDQCVVVLGILPDRKKDTVIDFLRSIPLRLIKTIETVCCDMYEGYTEAAREELPDADIVADRFHVTRHYNKAADQFRQQERKRLEKVLSAEEYRQLKGSMWAFRKRNADLTDQEHQVLQRLFAYSPDLALAYDFREQLTAIFEQTISRPQAKQLFRSWVKRVQHSGLTCFDDFIHTLLKWMDEICNYFINRDTSGFVEGFNNKVKVLKRRCYGIYNLQHLFQRLFLDVQGYHLFAY
jgi:transposase